MKFDELDEVMRVYETAHDHCVLPGIFIVARADGRSFTRLARDVHKFEAPFDERFRDLMVQTTEHLLTCGFNVIYGYTESDEISILFHPDDNTFSRKLRKLESVIAGEASAKFSLGLKDIGVFDCRICQLPSAKIVVDYFRWRNEDANRNAMNSHCYWLLRKEGLTDIAATERLKGLSVPDKNEFLFQKGINFNNLPSWQKRGVGLYWKDVPKEGFNPIKNEKVYTTRKQIYIDYDLPMKDDYGTFIKELVAKHLHVDVA